ncbi:MAG TPA: magnesium/cobalt transporter CorA [Fimbriimonadaceae bacterium]|nr:magnesium/cobalt transporter CorA [Fimbriimonadaceae bacterium]
MEPGIGLKAARWEGGDTLPVELTLGEFITECRRDLGLIWGHVTVFDTERGYDILRNHLGFSELEVEDALSPLERPAVQESPDHLFLVMPAVQATDDGEAYVECAYFLRPGLLVTVSTEPCGLIDKWFAKWMKAPKKYGTDSGDLLHTLLDATVDEYFPLIDRLEEVVEDLEDSLYIGSGAVIKEALALKRRLLEARRRISPMRDVINGLLRRDVSMVPQNVKPYFQDLYDHTIRLAESIDITRDILSGVLDAHLSITSNNLNVVMKKMTIISTLLMTCAFVAGVYGMNFKHMPELDWLGGYPFSLGVMVGLCSLELWLFRKKGWL